MTGSANPARCNSAPTSRRSAKGATRGDTPPSSSASAAANDCRNSVSVSPPIIAASNSPSGFSARRSLRQHAGQVVDELQSERGDHEIERLRRQRQRLGFHVRQIDAREAFDAAGQRVADLIADCADIGGVLEFAQHRAQPFRHVLGDAVEQESRGLPAPRAILSRPQQRAVEQDRRDARVQGHVWFGTPILPFLAIRLS